MLHTCLALIYSTFSGQAQDSLAARRVLTARQAQVHCAVTTGCPQGVGLWASLESKSLPSQCTAFLVAPDLALTNHHCLPDNARKPGADCRGQAWLHFPKLKEVPADSVSCREVVALSATSESIDQADWALVRLARPLQREVLPLSREGLLDLDSLTAWTCNPDWGQLLLRERILTELRPIDCRVSRRTQVFHGNGPAAEYSDPLSRRVPLSSCTAQKGNSGSPLLRRDADGVWRVHALLDRSASTSNLRDWMAQQELNLLDSTIGEFAYATNLACIPLPGAGPLPSVCERDSNPTAAMAQERAWKTEVEQAIASRVAQVSTQTPLCGKVLQKGAWTAFAKGVARLETKPEALVIPLPSCSSPGASDSLFHVPVWSMRFGYDRDLRWSFRMDLDRPQLAVLKRCRPLASSRGRRDVCRFDGRFPGVGAMCLATDTLTRCAEAPAL